MRDSTAAEPLDYASPGRAAARPPRPPMVRIVVVGLLLFPLLVVAAYPVARALPIGWTTVAVVEVPTKYLNDNGRPMPIHIGCGGDGRGPSVRMTRGIISYSADRSGYMDVDLLAMTYDVAAVRGYPPSPQPLTQSAMQAELEKVGFDAASGEASGLAATIISELQMLSAGRLPTFDATGGRGTRPPAYRISDMEGTRWPRYVVWWPWYTPWCVPIWIIASVLLGRWLLRRHRRKLAGFDPSSMS